MKQFTDIEETVYFWTRNDSAIICCLFHDNMDAVWKHAKDAINDNICILKEYENGTRVAGSYFGDPLDYKMIESLKKRVFEDLEDTEKKNKIVQIAKNDILNILNAMKPPKNKIMLYRSEWNRWNSIDDLSNYKVNDIVEFKDILSTCITPYKEETDYDFYRYEVTVPENGLILELDQFECHNEEGEVLLPPMKCRVKKLRNNNHNEKCRGIIELEYIKKLPINIDALGKTADGTVSCI